MTRRRCVAAETGDREGAIQLYLKGLGLNPCASPIITSLQKMGYNGPGLAAGSVSIQVWYCMPRNFVNIT